MVQKPPRRSDDLVDWFTVSYKTIYTAAGLVALLVAGAVYYYWLRNSPPSAPMVDEPRPSVTSARFTSIEGSIKVKTVGTFEWVTADRSIALKKGDLIRTSAGSTAEVTFFDGTVVHVRPDSLITIEETSEDPSTKARKVAWHISSGEVNFETVRHNVPGSATEISTPTVHTTAGELSAAAIRVAETGDSDVRVFGGSIEGQTKSGQRIQLAASEAVRVDAVGKAGPKLLLPAMPALLAPPHQAEISYIDPTRATTLLAWKPIPGAVSYHLMLDYSPYFNRPLVDRKAIHESSQELRGLDLGKYYWRVASVDKDGTESNFSDFFRFSITKPAGAAKGEGPPPLLIVSSLEVRMNILQSKGRTEPGATLTVNGQRIDVQPDGSFNEFITLDKAGRQELVFRATGINGGVSELRRTVVAGY